jgi:hypothetical protein
MLKKNRSADFSRNALSLASLAPAVALEHGDCPFVQFLLDSGAALPEGLESNPCG